jgi:hypothetical protein
VTEATYGDVQEARVEFSQPGIAQAVTIDGARAAILGEDVDGSGRLADELLAAGIPKIDRDPALMPSRAQAPARVGVLAVVVVLDADHVRAKIGDDLRAEGKRDEQFARQHPDSVKWQRVLLAQRRLAVCARR